MGTSGKWRFRVWCQYLIVSLPSDVKGLCVEKRSPSGDDDDDDDQVSLFFCLFLFFFLLWNDDTQLEKNYRRAISREWWRGKSENSWTFGDTRRKNVEIIRREWRDFWISYVTCYHTIVAFHFNVNREASQLDVHWLTAREKESLVLLFSPENCQKLGETGRRRNAFWGG